MTASVLAVCAHPDDDLLFHSPDLHGGIIAGIPTTVVYVTSGHAGLIGPAAAERVRNRQRGVQDAYRISAGVVDPAGPDEWDGEVVEVAGRGVEQYTLGDRPTVRLVFMGLPDAGLASVADGATVMTIPAQDGLITTPQAYDETTVEAVLEQLMHRSHPTVLRLTEEFTEARYDIGHHPDHRAMTHFALQAANRYRTSTAAWPPYVVEYRDYAIQVFPVNLDEESRNGKSALFDAYLPWDPAAGDPYGWTARCYYRRPGGTRWSAVDGDGTVHLLVIRDGTLLSWQGTDAGWDGPFALGEGLTAVTALRREDGRVQIVARTDDDRIVTRPADDDSWTDLGSRDTGADARDSGTPVLASNADGRLQVFRVNASGSLSTRWQTDVGGSWSGWVDLGGTDLLDPCSAALGPSGCIEVVATSRTGLTGWGQSEPNGALVAGPIPSLPPASPATLAINADDRLEVHYRQSGNAAVAISYQASDGTWGSTTEVGGHAGIGETATATVDGRIATAVRNRGGGVSVAVQTEPNGGYGDWTDLGGHIANYPTAAATPDGRLVIAAVHTDGALQQRTRSATGDWGPWEVVGPPL